MSRDDPKLQRFIDTVAKHLGELEVDLRPIGRAYLAIGHNTMEVARAYVEELSAWQCARNLCAVTSRYDEQH